MKRRYQIDQQRAVQQFRQLAREENPSIQMIFPMAEVVRLLQEGVGPLLREAGLALMNLVMEEEVRHLAGERHQQHSAGVPTAGEKKTVTAWWTGRRYRFGEPFAQPGTSRTTAGQLRVVPAQCAAGVPGVGQDDARAVDAQLRRGGEGVP
jgi:hypothetical protein